MLIGKLFGGVLENSFSTCLLSDIFRAPASRKRVNYPFYDMGRVETLKFNLWGRCDENSIFCRRKLQKNDFFDV